MFATRLVSIMIVLICVGWALPCNAEFSSPKSPKTAQDSPDKPRVSNEDPRPARELAPKKSTPGRTEFAMGDFAVMTAWGSLATVVGIGLPIAASVMFGSSSIADDDFLLFLIGTPVLAYLTGTTLGAYGVYKSGKMMGYDGSYKHTLLGVNLGLLGAVALLGITAAALDGDGDALGPLFLLALPVSMAAGGALGFYLSSSASDGDPAVSNAVPALLNRSDEGWSMGVPAVGVTPEGVNVWFLGGTF